MGLFHNQTACALLRVPSELKAALFALQLRNPDLSSIENLSDEEWNRLLAFCDIAHLTLPIAQLPTNKFPGWVVTRLKKNLADNALRFDRVKATYREAAEALARAGAEHAVMKGFTQAPDYVRHPQLRSQSDIDIFCPPEDIDRAHSALRAIGYEPSDVKISYAFADHIVTLVRVGDWKWKGNPFDPEMPLSLELHFCLWNEQVSQIRIPDVNAFWGRRTFREVDGLEFPCLCPVDQLAHLTLHILRNLFLQDWIVHHVRELANFLHWHADDDSFWRTWNVTQSPELRSFQAIAFYYARAWFDCCLHPLAESEIDSLPAIRKSWLNRFSGSALESMFRTNKDFIWLYLTFLPSRTAQLKIMRRLFIPSRIVPVGTVPLQVKNKRLVQPRGSNRWQQYATYLISRCADYARTNSAAIFRCLRWRLSRTTPIDAGTAATR